MIRSPIKKKLAIIQIEPAMEMDLESPLAWAEFKIKIE